MKKILIILIISSLGLICNAKNYVLEFIVEDSCSITTIEIKYKINKKWIYDKYNNRIFIPENIDYIIISELETYNLIEYWTAVDFYNFMDKINYSIKDMLKECYPNPDFKLIFGNYKSTNKCIK